MRCSGCGFCVLSEQLLFPLYVYSYGEAFPASQGALMHFKDKATCISL